MQNRENLLRLSFFVVLVLFLTSPILASTTSENCSSPATIQYKPDGSCDTQNRTCCKSLKWTEWNGSCSGGDNCEAGKECWNGSECEALLEEGKCPKISDGTLQKAECIAGSGWRYKCKCPNGAIKTYGNNEAPTCKVLKEITKKWGASIYYTGQTGGACCVISSPSFRLNPACLNMVTFSRNKGDSFFQSNRVDEINYGAQTKFPIACMKGLQDSLRTIYPLCLNTTTPDKPCIKTLTPTGMSQKVISSSCSGQMYLTATINCTGNFQIYDWQ